MLNIVYHLKNCTLHSHPVSPPNELGRVGWTSVGIGEGQEGKSTDPHKLAVSPPRAGG